MSNKVIKQLKELENQTHGTLTTAHGKVNKIFIRKKIKLIGSVDRMNQDEIHMILVQKDGARLMNDIIPEQLSIKQHSLLPNVRVYRNPLNNHLVLSGHMGVKEELVDKNYSTLHIHKNV